MRHPGAWICRPGRVLAAWVAAMCSWAVADDYQPPDLAKSNTVYAIATAHLDTQWNWTIQSTIRDCVPNTLQRNFAYFDKYPNYTFSFEGAFRYSLAKEYYPADYARLTNYIAQGRWRVCGSAVDAGDVNIVSPESLVRQFLCGNGYFKREFGKRSYDVFLPDCFGFGYALPTVAAHCGLKGFSTQKLGWGCWVGTPFDIGLWEGVDGSTLVAALNPGSYTSGFGAGANNDTGLANWLQNYGNLYGIRAKYSYYGTGDYGGAPDEGSVANVNNAVAGGGTNRVISTGADQLYLDLRPEWQTKLPRYKGELIMTTHGTGCYTSQSAMKRRNRRNECLADDAERASIAAHWLGGAAYPRAKINEAWWRFLWHQFHDDLTGTSIPDAYVFSQSDEALAQNRFAGVLEDAVGAVSRALDTRAPGTAVVVWNPLSFDRKDVAEADLTYSEGGVPGKVRVFGPGGEETPAQIVAQTSTNLKVVFVADVPSVGFSVYDVRPVSESDPGMTNSLIVTDTSLENERYRVAIDANGDVASVMDKAAGRELLAGPARLQLLTDNPSGSGYAQWEIWYSDVSAAPRACVTAGSSRVRVTESGPARATLEVTRQYGNSTYVQRLQLAAGNAGDSLVYDTKILWGEGATLLKQAFPFTASSSKATYDLGMGAIERGNNTGARYEVPAQQWADITHSNGTYGVAILSDYKCGWDKPGDNLLRLTLIHAPGSIRQDFGCHQMRYAVHGHAGDWRTGGVANAAARLNQSLRAFQAPAHDGWLGKSFSTLRVSSPQVAVRAIKLAEDGDEIIVRLQELNGSQADGVTVSAAAPITSVREVNGAEEPAGVAAPSITNGAFTIVMKAYQPRTFALRLAGPGQSLSPPTCQPLALPFDLRVTANQGEASSGFDGAGHAIPSELFPGAVTNEGIPFVMGPATNKNALVCNGQTLTFNGAGFNRLYLLASSVGATQGVFQVGAQTMNLKIQDFAGPIGLWDRYGVSSAFLRNDRIGWYATHRHNSIGGDELYVFSYFHIYRIDLPANAGTLTLPANSKIRILAATLAANANDETRPAGAVADQPANMADVQLPPQVIATAPPSPVTIPAGSTQTFTVTVTNGVSPITYTWRVDNVTVSAAGNSMDYAPTDSDIGNHTVDVVVADAENGIGRAAAWAVTVVSPMPAITVQPADTTAGVGLTATFSVMATGAAPLSYQWRTNGVNIAGATSASCTTPVCALTDSGTKYSVVVTNSLGNVTSAEAILTVVELTGLLGQYFDNMDFTSLKVTRVDPTVNFDWGSGSPDASVGPDTFSVRWTGQVQAQYSETYTFYTVSDDGVRLWVNGQLVVDSWVDQGPTEHSGTIPLAAGQKYDIKIEYYENGGGAAAKLLWSSASTAKAVVPTSQLLPAAGNRAPTVTAGASPTNGPAPLTVAFTATGADQDGDPLSYAWAFGDGTNSTVQNPGHIYTASGSYTATVTVSDGRGGTALASVGIVANAAPTAPAIAAQPTNVTVMVGQAAAFSVTATGAAPLSYQWKKNGTNIAGASAAIYTTPSTTLADDQAKFCVVVTNSLGSVTSAEATLTVVAAVYDTTDDHLGTTTAQGENAGAGETKEKAFDNSTSTKWLDFANANPSTRASWIQYAYTNGIAGKLVSYTITSANDYPERDPAVWQLLGSNNGGTNWIVVDSRSNVVFSARFQKQTFALSGSPTYAAYRLNIVSVANPASANSVQVAEIELLGVQVSTGSQDSDGDGLPDAWETANGLNPNDPSDGTADSDGDGMSNREEYIAGTNPRDAGSRFTVQGSRLEGGAFWLRFLTETGRLYGVVGKSDLLGTSQWVVVTNGLPGTGGHVEVRDPVTGAKKFYRVVVRME